MCDDIKLEENLTAADNDDDYDHWALCVSFYIGPIKQSVQGQRKGNK